MGFGDEISDGMFLAGFLLDSSKSMRDSIDTLNDSMNAMVETAVKNPTLCDRSRVTIITYNSEVTTICKNCRWDEIPNIHLEASGSTNMAEAMDMGVAITRDFKRECVKNGITVFKPELTISTDGYPDTSVKEQVNLIRRRVDEGKLNVHCIGFGEFCDMQLLRTIDPEAMRISECDYKLYFEGMGSALAAISEDPGDEARRDELPQTIIEQMDKDAFCPKTEE